MAQFGSGNQAQLLAAALEKAKHDMAVEGQRRNRAGSTGMMSTQMGNPAMGNQYMYGMPQMIQGTGTGAQQQRAVETGIQPGPEWKQLNMPGLVPATSGQRIPHPGQPPSQQDLNSLPKKQQKLVIENWQNKVKAFNEDQKKQKKAKPKGPAMDTYGQIPVAFPMSGDSSDMEKAMQQMYLGSDKEDRGRERQKRLSGGALGLSGGAYVAPRSRSRQPNEGRERKISGSDRPAYMPAAGGGMQLQQNSQYATMVAMAGADPSAQYGMNGGAIIPQMMHGMQQATPSHKMKIKSISDFVSPGESSNQMNYFGGHSQPAPSPIIPMMQPNMMAQAPGMMQPSPMVPAPMMMNPSPIMPQMMMNQGNMGMPMMVPQTNGMMFQMPGGGDPGMQMNTPQVYHTPQLSSKKKNISDFVNGAPSNAPTLYGGGPQPAAIVPRQPNAASRTTHNVNEYVQMAQPGQNPQQQRQPQSHGHTASGQFSQPIVPSRPAGSTSSTASSQGMSSASQSSNQSRNRSQSTSSHTTLPTTGSSGFGTRPSHVKKPSYLDQINQGREEQNGEVPKVTTRSPTHIVNPNPFHPFIAMIDLNAAVSDDEIPVLPKLVYERDVSHSEWDMFVNNILDIWEHREPGVNRYHSAVKRVSAFLTAWNYAFFNPRGLDIVLFKGNERRSGQLYGVPEDRIQFAVNAMPFGDDGGSSGEEDGYEQYGRMMGPAASNFMAAVNAQKNARKAHSQTELEAPHSLVVYSIQIPS